LSNLRRTEHGTTRSQRWVVHLGIIGPGPTELGSLSPEVVGSKNLAVLGGSEGTKGWVLWG